MSDTTDDYAANWRDRTYYCTICGDGFAVAKKPYSPPKVCKCIDCRREIARRLENGRIAALNSPKGRQE